MKAIDPKVLYALKSLEEGWADDLASPIDSRALALLDAVQVVPTVVGGWQIEWAGPGENVEIEVDVDGRVRALTVERP